MDVQISDSVTRRWIGGVKEHPEYMSRQLQGGGAAGENHARGSRAACSYCLPEITEIAFKALSTLNVRRAETFPRFTNSVTYLQENLGLLWNID